MIDAVAPSAARYDHEQRRIRRPRLGFLGVGWIGLNRLEAITKAAVAEVAAIGEPSAEMLRKAMAVAPTAVQKGR